MCYILQDQNVSSSQANQGSTLFTTGIHKISRTSYCSNKLNDPDSLKHYRAMVRYFFIVPAARKNIHLWHTLFQLFLQFQKLILLLFNVPLYSYMYFYLSQRLSQPPIQFLHKYTVYLNFLIINCVISDYINIWCKKMDIQWG